MLQGISSHVFLPRRLTPALLDTLVLGGAATIEIFAARHHFDYTDRDHITEIAAWFRSSNITAALHMPLFPEAEWSRHTAPTLNLIDPSKAARIAAQDEVKRALESAEQIPFRTCILHLGLRDDIWDTRSLDDSLSAIEHLKAFAGPLGIQLVLENLNNEIATPTHLVEIVRIGHFTDIGFCLSTGHVNLTQSSMQSAFEAFADNLSTLHLHDNHGANTLRDEHLWPGEGTIDWHAVAACIAALKTPPTGILEIAHELGADPDTVATKSQAAFRFLQTI